MRVWVGENALVGTRVSVGRVVLVGVGDRVRVGVQEGRRLGKGVLVFVIVGVGDGPAVQDAVGVKVGVLVTVGVLVPVGVLVVVGE